LGHRCMSHGVTCNDMFTGFPKYLKQFPSRISPLDTEVWH